MPQPTQQLQQALDKQAAPSAIQTLIQKSVKDLAQALPAHLNSERLVRIALTSIRLNPSLAKCSPESFLGALFVLAQMGLEPIAGRSYLIPFNNKRKFIDPQTRKEIWKTIPEVQAVIGYKGLVELFYRHNLATSIDMHTVCANDEFAYEYGSNSYIRHREHTGERGDAIGYYAVAKLKGNASIFRYMSKNEVVEHAKKHSKSWNTTANDFVDYSPWKTEFDAMAMKTVLIQLTKLLPLSVELQQAISVDETTREYREGIHDALDLPDTTNWTEPPIEAVAEDENSIKTQLMKAQAKIGREKFLEVIGGYGCTTIDEVQDKDAEKILADCKKIFDSMQE